MFPTDSLLVLLVANTRQPSPPASQQRMALSLDLGFPAVPFPFESIPTVAGWHGLLIFCWGLLQVNINSCILLDLSKSSQESQPIEDGASLVLGLFSSWALSISLHPLTINNFLHIMWSIKLMQVLLVAGWPKDHEFHWVAMTLSSGSFLESSSSTWNCLYPRFQLHRCGKQLICENASTP